MRHSTRDIKSVNNHGRGLDLSRIPPTSSKIKGQRLHDRHIKNKTFKEGDLVLMYDNKSFQHPGKIRMHCLGPYEVKYVTDGVAVHLKYLSGTKIEGMINGSQLKLHKESRPPTAQ
jgi:hypothetical protein